MPEKRVLAVLGTGVVPADLPVLRADDLGAVRGDGVFETLHVRHGRAWLLDEHLARMARSAARLDLDLPAATDLIGLTDQALAAWPGADEGALRLVCTRGPETGGPATVYAMVTPVSAGLRQARRNGVAVRTATLGVPADLRQHAPWLLGGAKTLSYAVNMATQRWAATVGADDVLWTSIDGYALEGPTSSLVWLVNDELRTVPAATTGILPGTTAGYLLAHAHTLGWRTAERLTTPAGLLSADAVWLVSSVRGIVAIHTLDDTPLRGCASRTADVRTLLGFNA